MQTPIWSSSPPPLQDVADLLRGDCALLDAAKKATIARVQKLLSGANLRCRDSQGRNPTPLHLAAGYNLEVSLVYIGYIGFIRILHICVEIFLQSVI